MRQTTPRTRSIIIATRLTVTARSGEYEVYINRRKVKRPQATHSAPPRACGQEFTHAPQAFAGGCFSYDALMRCALFSSRMHPKASPALTLYRACGCRTAVQNTLAAYRVSPCCSGWREREGAARSDAGERHPRFCSPRHSATRHSANRRAHVFKRYFHWALRDAYHTIQHSTASGQQALRVPKLLSEAQSNVAAAPTSPAGLVTARC